MLRLFVTRCSIRRPVHHVRCVFNASKELESRRERALVGGGKDRIVAQHEKVWVMHCVWINIVILVGKVNSKGEDRAVG